ncbi:FAD:protein FMN transferase [Pseudoduganella danionis]|uniref:FAD:protein FMN transferase n=1 Tax=Pseudoduganella danionis TaxID=1890295 RepID=UPI0035B2DF4C
MEIFRLPFGAMASQCEIVLAAPDLACARTQAAAAMAEVARIEHKYSRYRPDSIVARINQAAGRTAVQCDDETLALLQFADELYQHSAGLFDLTSGVLRQAWDFRQPRLPDPARLAECLQRIGWPRVQRDGASIYLPQAGMQLDFGGFGKEYAADRAADVLRQHGVQHGYVNLAGDFRILGPRPNGTPWQIGIQDPRQRDRLVASIPVLQGALTTSGDYERYFELDGQRYCHILDPRDGQPVRYWRSVTILAPLAIVAGGVSTIAMLKQQQGLAYLEASGYSYLAIDHQGQPHQAVRHQTP